MEELKPRTKDFQGHIHALIALVYNEDRFGVLMERARSIRT